MNASRGAPAAGRQCALRCDVPMSDEHQTPPSTYYGADLTLAQSICGLLKTGWRSGWDSKLTGDFCSRSVGHMNTSNRRCQQDIIDISWPAPQFPATHKWSPPVNDMPRKSVPSRSRGFGLRGRVMAGNSGGFCAPQTQVSGSSELLVADFLRPSGFGSGRSAAVAAHRAAKVSGGWSAKALCGRTWLYSCRQRSSLSQLPAR